MPRCGVWARVLIVLVVCLTLIGSVSLSAQAVPAWAPAATATIHPGVMTVTAGGQCTANFVFFDGADNVYLGQAAHCSSTSPPTVTDGCLADSLPLDTPVQVQGASQPGTLVYSSWVAMDAAGESDPNTCAHNDFALVRISPADSANVNPSVPHWGGPVGLNTSGVGPGALVYSYGNSSLRLGLTPLSPKIGVTLGTRAGGWDHAPLFVTPGIPGDSGSAALDPSGNALGVLVALGVIVSTEPTLPVNNPTSDLSRALAYAQSHGMPGIQLAVGTEPFNPVQLPLDL
jgi:hypothetical protein